MADDDFEERGPDKEAPENINAGTEKPQRKKNEFTAKCILTMRDVVDAMADARRKHKDTQEIFAEKVGSTVEYIGKIEQKQSKLPAYLMKRYCEEYNLSADRLFSLTRPIEEQSKMQVARDEMFRLPKEYLDIIYEIIQLYESGL